jgi:HPt (histidine-containing phosphotransfer) domain-containing protein
MNTTVAKTIDLTYIRLVANGNEPFEAEMLLSLQAEIDQKMEAMRYDLADSRRESVRLCAHSLKNLFAMLGAFRLRDGFLLMETESMSVNNEYLKRQYDVLKEDWSQVEQEVALLLAMYNDRAAA